MPSLGSLCDQSCKTTNQARYANKTDGKRNNRIRVTIIIIISSQRPCRRRTVYNFTCWYVRKPRTALSSARRVLPHAENNFCMRRIVSACGDSCSTCGGPSPQTGVPRAEERRRFVQRTVRRFVFRVRRTLSACGELSFICILYTQKAAL